jgi:hypothetical protein
MLRRILVSAFIAVPFLLLVSCGSRAVGYGVVLWGEKSGTPQTGAVVAVVQTPTASAPLLISVPGERTPREYPAGRIRMFKSRRDASTFASTYGANLMSWAVVIKEDSPPLPVRDTPTPEGKVVYRLQYRQLVKVVSRSAEKMTVKPYSDYWYELATEDGYTGWCFGHFLKPFSVAGDPSTEAQRILSQDEVLAKIMGTTWRPDWFLTQAGRGMIDLAMFRDDVGLFPSPADRLMKLVLPLSTFEFHYTGDPQKVGASSYIFPGTDLRIDVLDDQRINVSYRYKDQPVSAIYSVMTDDVTQIITDEQKRRSDLFDQMVKKGSSLSSSAYGTIHLQQGMRFTWDGFAKLVPSLIATSARGSGTVDFPLHVAKGLAADYDGVVTFVFDSSGDTQPSASFLYKAAAGGMRFTSLARDSVQDLSVMKVGISPVVIFFSQSP